MTKDVYILGGLRSHIGLKNGIYKNIPAERLGAALLTELNARFPLADCDKIICGNAVGAGGNITRLMSLSAGFNMPSVTVDSQCSSGLEAVRLAAAEIAAGYCDCVVCGGFESASTQPARVYSANHPDYAERLENGTEKYFTAQFSPDAHTEDVMLRTAENTAKHFGISRADTDKFVLESHRKAAQAARDGVLKDLICSLFGSERDEGIRESMSESLLKRLRPVLADGEHITAANSCLINDGAALLVLCSEKYIKRSRVKPSAKIIGFSETVTEPQLAPYSAVTACKSLRERYGIESDCYEVNEAFALIDVLAERYLGDMSGYNIFGGALAYGHPYGASGAVILLHLIRALEYTDKRYGAAAVAAAGGQGCSILIERVK